MTASSTSTGHEMERGLRNRHIQMIAMGTAIGTGLFLVSATTIQTAGPIVLLDYVVAGFIIFLVMRMLGEMAVARPIPGSYSTYAHDYIGKAAGFIVGWNWWFTCIVVGMLELTATGVFLDYWFPGMPHWVTALVALLVITGANMIHVSAFGEFEFWFSIIKVAAIVATIVLGLALIVGIGPGEPIGFSNLWVHGGFAPNGLLGFVLALVSVTFTFGGIESLGTTAGEARNPSVTIPKAINRTIYRILIFYVGAIGVMLTIWPWNQVGLEGSPFVLILDGLGIQGAAFILNVVVLTAALSVFNAMVYSNARVLYGMAQNHQAPALFTRTNRRGVPAVGLLVNAAVTGIVVLLNYLFPGQVLQALVAIILGAELITWSAIVLSHLRFRRIAQAQCTPLGFPAPLYPHANYLCLTFFALILILMFVIPDFRTGAFVLPVWLLVLYTASRVQRTYTQRAGTAASTEQNAQRY